MEVDEQQLARLIQERDQLKARVDELLTKLGDSETARREFKETVDALGRDVAIYRRHAHCADRDAQANSVAAEANARYAEQLDVGLMVQQFHEAFGVLARGKPQWPTYTEAWLRYRLIDEEVQELKEAIQAGDVVEVADALGDILYVVHGAFLTFGIDPYTVVAEIHRSNMTKTDGGTREDGKILKGENYSPPDLVTVLKNQGWKEGDK